MCHTVSGKAAAAAVTVAPSKSQERERERRESSAENGEASTAERRSLAAAVPQISCFLIPACFIMLFTITVGSRALLFASHPLPRSCLASLTLVIWRTSTVAGVVCSSGCRRGKRERETRRLQAPSKVGNIILSGLYVCTSLPSFIPPFFVYQYNTRQSVRLQQQQQRLYDCLCACLCVCVRVNLADECLPVKHRLVHMPSYGRRWRRQQEDQWYVQTRPTLQSTRTLLLSFWLLHRLFIHFFFTDSLHVSYALTHTHTLADSARFGRETSLATAVRLQEEAKRRKKK